MPHSLWASAADIEGRRRLISEIRQVSNAIRGESFKQDSIFLGICCENEAIFLDLVTMRGRDVPKQEPDSKLLLCMEFLSRSSASDSRPIAFGEFEWC